MIINRKTTKKLTPGEHKVFLKGIRCVGGCKADGTGDGVAIEEEGRMWSNPASWPSGKVPVAGDEIIIEAGWNMIFDLVDSPIFKMITIDGKLSFKQKAISLKLNVNQIYIRSGELEIGNETHPYSPEAEIVLYGRKNEAAITYNNAIEAGSKLIANTGTLKLFGNSRAQTMTRLLKEAKRGDTSIFVEPGLELFTGDKIAILPSSYGHNAGDFKEVSLYDKKTGEIKLNRDLHYYHWGAAESTALKYNGIDMRTEVLILSRNIKIRG